jgi:hypothetical protein
MFKIVLYSSLFVNDVKPKAVSVSAAEVVGKVALCPFEAQAGLAAANQKAALIVQSMNA